MHGGRSNGPYANSLPLLDHFQGGEGGGGGWVWGGRGAAKRGGAGSEGGGEGGCQEGGGGEASYPDKYGIRIGCLTPAFWEAHKWAEMLHHPCILGDPEQRGHCQSKNRNKQKQKFSHSVPCPAYSLADYPQWGLNPGCCNCRGTALPTRVWPISDISLHRGGIDIWSNLVFIH